MFRARKDIYKKDTVAPRRPDDDDDEPSEEERAMAQRNSTINGRVMRDTIVQNHFT